MRTASQEGVKAREENGRRRYCRHRPNQAQQILTALRDGPLTVRDLIRLLHGSPEAVRQAVGKLRRFGQVRRVDASFPLYALECRIEIGEERDVPRTRGPAHDAPARPRKPRSNGSGIKAGRIEIGRGSRWGASIV